RGHRPWLHHPPRAQPLDVAPRVAEAREHAVRVLAERRRRRADRGRGVGELDRVPERLPAAFQVDHHAPVADLRVAQHLAERRHRAEADVEVGEPLDPLRHSPLAEAGADGVEHRFALGPFDELLLSVLRQPELDAQRQPEVGLERTDRDVAAVPRIVDRVARTMGGTCRYAARRLHLIAATVTWWSSHTLA